MPDSRQEKAFVDYVVELMQSVGPVSARAMFGGHGIFLDGLMFGLIADSVLYLKVGKDNKDDYIQRDLEPFTYNKNGKLMKMSYYQAPEETLEDADEMNTWASRAYAAALQAAAGKRKATKE